MRGLFAAPLPAEAHPALAAQNFFYELAFIGAKVVSIHA